MDIPKAPGLGLILDEVKSCELSCSLIIEIHYSYGGTINLALLYVTS